MLSSLIRANSSYLINNSIKHVKSTSAFSMLMPKLSSSSITRFSSSGAYKQAFPDEKFKKRVNDEYKKAAKRIMTIPNVLTFSRIGVTPFIGYFIWNGMNTEALACFAFAAVTDLLDGFIARTFDQDSDLGAILDPLADKFLLMTTFVALYNTGIMPIWLVKGFITRDLLILGFGATFRYYGFEKRPSIKQYFDLKNYPTIGMEPTFTSKCNTALQCLLISLHLGTSHLVGVPVYDFSMSALTFTTMSTSAITLCQYASRTSKIRTIRSREFKPLSFSNRNPSNQNN